MPEVVTEGCEYCDQDVIRARGYRSDAIGSRVEEGTPSATKPHAAVTEANACASSLELGGEHVVINHRAPQSQ
ncbi:hypothetical protein CROQUDRAFT_87281 [Cronartium quercuum f. sp. fusiforme G11]|uniref:Uncharacterized protein n=1 Tax=Cronartium quercuum f. sp. fusiforme G11 TaxID=708437 RepID=A0A9P6NSF4_9BASI|nr:hypothetical protein CROQUDRAFT_87281 [Cronartium quercuum f. sp. fusiforme G11]